MSCHKINDVRVFLKATRKKSGKRHSFPTWHIQKLSSAVMTATAKILNATERAKHIANGICANPALAFFKVPIPTTHGSLSDEH